MSISIASHVKIIPLVGVSDIWWTDLPTNWNRPLDSLVGWALTIYIYIYIYITNNHYSKLWWLILVKHKNTNLIGYTFRVRSKKSSQHKGLWSFQLKKKLHSQTPDYQSPDHLGSWQNAFQIRYTQLLLQSMQTSYCGNQVSIWHANLQAHAQKSLY